MKRKKYTNCFLVKSGDKWDLMVDAMSIYYSIVALDHDYHEYFVPYSNIELKDYFHEYEEIFENPVFFNVVHVGRIDESEIIPDTANIILDAMWCAYAVKHQDLDKGVEKSDFIGIYTEFLKMDIERTKHVISALLYLLNSNDSNNTYLANEFLIRIKEEYSIGVEFSYENKDSIFNALMFLCHGNTNENSLECCLQVDFKNFEKFISLLKKYEKEVKQKYAKKESQNCFCLTREGNRYFFSLSGYNDSDGYFIEYAKQIENDLKEYIEKETVSYCPLCGDTLSYGYCDGEIFIKYKSPKKYSEFSKKGRGGQFSCCERKIFHYTIDFKSDINIYCKFSPCTKCQPAVEEQKYKRNTNNKGLSFYSFAKDPHELEEKMNNKLELNVNDLELLFC